jgi:hypothetical protein
VKVGKSRAELLVAARLHGRLGLTEQAGIPAWGH